MLSTQGKKCFQSGLCFKPYLFLLTYLCILKRLIFAEINFHEINFRGFRGFFDKSTKISLREICLILLSQKNYPGKVFVEAFLARFQFKKNNSAF